MTQREIIIDLDFDLNDIDRNDAHAFLMKIIKEHERQGLNVETAWFWTNDHPKKMFVLVND